MSYRFIDEDALMRAVRRALPKRPGDRFRELIEGKVRRWLRRQPAAPRLVSRQRAAEILGVQSPHIARLQRQERMPEPIEVEGGYTVYVLEEIERLAKELKKERAERKRAKKKGASR